MESATFSRICATPWRARSRRCAEAGRHHHRSCTRRTGRHPVYENWTKIDNLASPLYYPAMLAEYRGGVVTAVRAIANAAQDAWCSTARAARTEPACWPWCSSRGGGDAGEIVADYLLTYDRMKHGTTPSVLATSSPPCANCSRSRDTTSRRR